MKVEGAVACHMHDLYLDGGLMDDPYKHSPLGKKKIQPHPTHECLQRLL